MLRFKPSRITLVGILSLWNLALVRRRFAKNKKKKYKRLGNRVWDLQTRSVFPNSERVLQKHKNPKLFYSRCDASSPNNLLLVPHGNVICMSAFFRVGQFAVYQVQQ